MEDNKLEIVISPGSVSHSSTSCDEWMRKMATEIKGETGGNYQHEGLKVPRVPSTFRRIEKNKNCYDPSMVSLGPYHHGKRELREMEELKLPMARQFVRDCNVPFAAMWSKVKELNIDASKCYEEDSTACFNKDQFAQMMFLDGCFCWKFQILVKNSYCSNHPQDFAPEEQKQALFKSVQRTENLPRNFPENM